MTEKLLHFIWRFQYFNRSNLQTTSGEKIQIIHPGQYNTGQGPDFLQARICINNTLLAGSVELHHNTSDWKRHGHSSDKNYNNVVLHVVFGHDNNEGSDHLPVLELQHRVSTLLLHRYEQMMQSGSFIPCNVDFDLLPALTLQSWMDRLLAERLQRKSGRVLDQVQKTRGDWEEGFWHMLARSFGSKTNGDAFEAIAVSLPFHLLLKHRHSIQQMEALLLGQANLLGPRFEEEYPKLLYREYCFLKQKYKLQAINLPVHFLRMRPTNFPTVRLAQLAAVIYHSAHLFSKILECPSTSELETLFQATANDYWHYHFRLDEPSAFQPKHVGKEMIHHIIINVVVPVIFALGNHRRNQVYIDKAIRFLEDLPAEKNAITKGFTVLNLKPRHAADAQALLELKLNYCNERRCLECSVGNYLLGRGMSVNENLKKKEETKG